MQRVGPHMPEFLEHAGYSGDRIVATSFPGTEGVFGTPIAISSTFILMSMVFAAMLQRTGMERFFIELAFGATGCMTGGAATSRPRSSPRFCSSPPSSWSSTTTRSGKASMGCPAANCPACRGSCSPRAAVYATVVVNLAVQVVAVVIRTGTKAVITALVGIYCVSAAVVGYSDRPLSLLLRGVLAATGLLLLYGELTTDSVGLGGFVVVFVYQWWSGRRMRAADVG